MPSLQAEETLASHGSRLSAPALKRLVLLATGSEEQAEKAYVERIAAQMSQGQQPEL